jgi:hypothetical protein
LKRKDAFRRKVRTICQRLDEVDLTTFEVEPVRLYLYGSALTDKPVPNDIDLILIFERSDKISPEEIYRRMVYRVPLPDHRAVIHLRRGMQGVRISTAERSLENWEQQSLFLVIQPRLIWEPNGNWRAVIDDIEVNPLPWPGPRPADAKEQHEAFIKSMPHEQYETRLAQALAEIQAQQLQPAE